MLAIDIDELFNAIIAYFWEIGIVPGTHVGEEFVPLGKPKLREEYEEINFDFDEEVENIANGD